MVYLIHFERPFWHAQHYMGSCGDSDMSLNLRLKWHRSNNGARLLRAVNLAGIRWWVVRTWPEEGRKFERQKKRQSHLSRLCPICERARQLELFLA